MSAGLLMTQEMAGGTRMVLPLRVLPMPLRQFGRGMVILGAMLALAGFSPLLRGESGGFGAGHGVAVLAALVPLALGLMLLRGRSTLSCTSGKLVVHERAMLVSWRRSFELASIRSLKVEVLPLNLVGKAGTSAPESIPILAAEIASRGRLVLLFGYPAPLLEQVVTELRRRTGWRAGASG